MYALAFMVSLIMCGSGVQHQKDAVGVFRHSQLHTAPYAGYSQLYCLQFGDILSFDNAKQSKASKYVVHTSSGARLAAKDLETET